MDNSIVSKHLGQTSQYKSTYDPSLLVKEPRRSNRVHLGLVDDNLPFVGYDVWNAYEVSCLLKNCVPIAAYAKIVYPCNNLYIVESKSLKLYLNSFNMYPMGDTVAEALVNLEVVISNDLSDLLGVTVHVSLYDASLAMQNRPSTVSLAIEDIHVYKTLETIVDTSALKTNTYTEDRNLLQWATSEVQTVQAYHSALLKSNCRVTGQPDWGDVYIKIVSNKIVDPASLLKYIISFRGENHFHEEIIETIYRRLDSAIAPTQLLVQGLYVRRGGIDINPVRASAEGLIFGPFVKSNCGCIQTNRQ